MPESKAKDKTSDKDNFRYYAKPSKGCRALRACVRCRRRHEKCESQNGGPGTAGDCLSCIKQRIDCSYKHDARPDEGSSSGSTDAVELKHPHVQEERLNPTGSLISTSTSMNSFLTGVVAAQHEQDPSLASPHISSGPFLDFDITACHCQDELLCLSHMFQYFRGPA